MGGEGWDGAGWVVCGWGRVGQWVGVARWGGVGVAVGGAGCGWDRARQGVGGAVQRWVGPMKPLGWAER